MAHDTRHATATTSREWLFKSRGNVFGPIPEGTLAAMLETGELDGATEVAGDDGRWRQLHEVPELRVHVRRAEARARVESEVTAARKLVRRRRAVRGAVLAIAGALVVAAAGTAAWRAASRRSSRSALLEAFDGAIAIGSVRVGAGQARAVDDEIAVPGASPGGDDAAAGRAKRAAPAPRAVAESARGVLARYDAAQVQEVVARHQNSLAPCLREEAARSPEFSGEIPIEFAVANDGRVAQLWIDEPRFRAGELRECLFRKLREWSFQPFAGERPVVSVAFRIGK
jgi:hypothetical protein